MLVSEILERAQSEFLYAGNVSIPSWDVQVGAITASDTTLTLEGREEYLAGDSVIEWDDATMELALVKSTAGAVATLQTRGYLESTAATHAAGTRVIFDPPYPKRVLLNALRSVIGSLYSFGLYATDTDTSLTFSSLSPRTLPAGAKDTLSVIYVAESSRYVTLEKGRDFEVLHFFTPKKVQFFPRTYEGAALTVPYKKDFTRPSLLADDLDVLAVPSSLQEGLPMAVAAWILQGRDVPKTQADHIRRALEAQAAPLGSSTNVGRTLWAMFIQTYVQGERQRQLESSPHAIEGA